jgi:hypothetical protein
MATPQKVVFMRAQDRSSVVHTCPQPEPIPIRESKLQCTCGSTHFFVTRIDFVCTACSKSYCD